jgi:predicted nucleic acid-binding protein
VLIDTNALLRTLQVRHPHFETIAHALELLPTQGRNLHIVPQNLVELWVVATRPVAQNGLGLTTVEAAAELRRIKRMFVLLPETSAIYSTWEALVTRHAVSGKPSHDARLVAAMRVHGLTAILTFDKAGFSRFPGIEVVHPADVHDRYETWIAAKTHLVERNSGRVKHGGSVDTAAALEFHA